MIIDDEVDSIRFFPSILSGASIGFVITVMGSLLLNPLIEEEIEIKCTQRNRLILFDDNNYIIQEGINGKYLYQCKFKEDGEIIKEQYLAERTYVLQGNYEPTIEIYKKVTIFKGLGTMLNDWFFLLPKPNEEIEAEDIDHYKIYIPNGTIKDKTG